MVLFPYSEDTKEIWNWCCCCWWSHDTGGRLPLLSARPAVNSPAAEHQRPMAGTKLYCLVTEVHVCKQLAQGCTRQRGGRESKPRPVDRKSDALTARPPSYTFIPPSFRLAASVLWRWSWEKGGEQLKWSLAFTLYIGRFPCAQLPGPVHTARLGRVCFLCVHMFVLCVFICPFWFVCIPILLCFLGQLSHLPYSFWR